MYRREVNQAFSRSCNVQYAFSLNWTMHDKCGVALRAPIVDFFMVVGALVADG